MDSISVSISHRLAFQQNTSASLHKMLPLESLIKIIIPGLCFCPSFRHLTERHPNNRFPSLFSTLLQVYCLVCLISVDVCSRVITDYYRHAWSESQYSMRIGQARSRVPLVRNRMHCTGPSFWFSHFISHVICGKFHLSSFIKERQIILVLLHTCVCGANYKDKCRGKPSKDWKTSTCMV